MIQKPRYYFTRESQVFFSCSPGIENKNEILCEGFLYFGWYMLYKLCRIQKIKACAIEKKNSVIRNRQLPSFYGARKLSKCLKVAKVKSKYQRSFLQIVYGQWRFSTYFAHFKRSFQVICKWTTVLALSFSRVPRATHHFQNEFPPRGISRMILVPLFILRVFSQEC